MTSFLLQVGMTTGGSTKSNKVRLLLLLFRCPPREWYCTGGMANVTDAYCVPGATNFNKAYSRVHGYIALAICVVGSATNSINIAVLSRREMSSSTNSILTGLAVADLLVMLEYIPFVLHMNIKIGPQINKNTYAWAVFVYFHSIFSQTFHTISIWLAVTLAVWRYVAIAFPQRNRTWCSKKNTTIAIVSAYVICPFLCLPIYFAMNIVPSEVTPQNNSEFAEDLALPKNRTVYVLEMSKNVELVTAIMWIYSVILKLVPSIALSILSTCLISKLTTTERRRQKLLMRSAVGPNEVREMFILWICNVKRTWRHHTNIVKLFFFLERINTDILFVGNNLVIKQYYETVNIPNVERKVLK